MPFHVIPHRASRFAAAALLALLMVAVAACRDSTGPDDDHAEEVAAIRLTITAAGIQPRVVTFTQGQAAPTVQLPTGTSTVTAVWLADDGDVVDLDAEYFLQIDQIAPAGAFTFQRTTATVGTITAPSAAAATARVCVMHVSHCDLSFATVTFQIAN